MNIDSFYLNSVLLSPVGYLPLELDAITKSEMWRRIERIGWIGARTRARREKGHFGARTKTLRGREKRRTEGKCKGKRIEFIKRFFFLPKRSRALDHFPSFTARSKSAQRRHEIFSRDLLRNTFTHSSNPHERKSVLRGKISLGRCSPSPLLYFFRIHIYTADECISYPQKCSRYRINQNYRIFLFNL